MTSASLSWTWDTPDVEGTFLARRRLEERGGPSKIFISRLLLDDENVLRVDGEDGPEPCALSRQWLGPLPDRGAIGALYMAYAAGASFKVLRAIAEYAGVPLTILGGGDA